MNKNQMVAEQLLPTIAYGDALGLPFETKPPLAVGSLNELHDTETNPYIGQFPAGTWSDDTHLSLAVAKSLIEAGEFDLTNMAKWHVAALNHVRGEMTNPDLVPPIATTAKHTGWGPSTTKSIDRIAAGVDPTESGAANGTGNGVLMKMAPLVLWQFAAKTSTALAEAQTVEFTQMTHNASEAVVASLVHRNYLARLLEKGQTPAIQDVTQVARDYETEFAASPVLSEMLGRLAAAATNGTLNRDDILQATPKKGFYAPETLVMAYGSFAIEEHFPASIYRAVELGGDSDSVGAVVAAMAVCHDPSLPKPADYNKIFAVERLERVSHQLGRVIAERAKP